jgi:hypothetical protein
MITRNDGSTDVTVFPVLTSQVKVTKQEIMSGNPRMKRILRWVVIECQIRIRKALRPDFPRRGFYEIHELDRNVCLQAAAKRMRTKGWAAARIRNQFAWHCYGICLCIVYSMKDSHFAHMSYYVMSRGSMWHINRLLSNEMIATALPANLPRSRNDDWTACEGVGQVFQGINTTENEAISKP